MSQTLTVELSDKTYTALELQAKEAGSSAAGVAATILEQQINASGGSQENGKPQTETEKQAARERFERHFGAVNLGYATGADNEGIDIDLAREYADTHEND